MGNITLFKNNDAQLPAHLQKGFADEETNIKLPDTLPSLGFRGSKWRIRVNDEEKLLTKTIDGEPVPIPSIQVIVLDMNKKRSRTYYEGAFVEGENKAPACWSTDGEKPDKNVPKPCAATCAACPNSVKGSRMTEQGKETTACQTLKRLAVIPASRLDMEPLLLKVPQTSLWDKDNKEAEAQGYYAWDQYLKVLHNRGVPHTAAVVTQIKFDQNTAYPKLLFTAARWLTEEELTTVKALVHDERVLNIINGNVKDVIHGSETTQDDGDSEEFETEEEEIEPPKKQAKAAPKPASKPKAAAKPKPDPVEDFEDDEDEEEPEPPKPVKSKAKSKPAPKVEELDEGDFDEDDEEEAPKPRSKSKKSPEIEDVDDFEEVPKAAKKASSSKSGNSKLDSLIDDWDDL